MEKLGSLYPAFVDTMIDRASIFLEEAALLFEGREGWEDRKGGYLCIANAETGFPGAVVLIGSIPTEKAEKYLSFSMEKARRLASNPQHVSSWESRDPEQNRWGGAIRIDELIFSFSGLPELGDEALMLALGLSNYLSDPNIPRLIEDIAHRSKNPYWKPFLGFMSRHS